MKKITEKFICDVCEKEAYHCETISVGIEPRDGLSSSSCEESLIKNYEICEDCYESGEAIIKLKWKTTADDDQVGKCVTINSSIKI